MILKNVFRLLLDRQITLIISFGVSIREIDKEADNFVAFLTFPYFQTDKKNNN